MSRATYISAALSVAICRIIGTFVSPVYDDAFITFRYARNLATGNSFVYNPAEWVLGTTSPLFGVVGSLFYRIGLPMPYAVLGLNIVLDVLLLSLTLVAMRSDARRRFAVIFASFFALSPSMTRVCVGGMEMNLFLTGSFLAILMYTSGKNKAAAVVASALYFIRPEALMLLALLVALELFRRGKSVLIQIVFLPLATLILPLTLVHHVYGQFLPQSVLAKSQDSSSLFTVVKQLLAPDPLAVLLLLPAAAGMLITIRRTGTWRIVAIWMALYVAAFCFARPMMWSWYGEPVYYGVLLFAAIGLTEWIDRKIWISRRINVSVATSACILPIVVWTFLLIRLGPSPVTSNVYRPLESWCRLHVNKEDTIVASDIGAVGYYSNARIYDLAGLVTPTGQREPLPDLIQNLMPEFLFLNSTRPNVEMMGSGSFASMYEPVARFSKTGDHSLELVPEKFPSHWVQDYLMFQRIVPARHQ